MGGEAMDGLRGVKFAFLLQGRVTGDGARRGYPFGSLEERYAWLTVPVFARSLLGGLPYPECMTLRAIRHTARAAVLISEWRCDEPGPRPAPAEVSCYGGVAREL